MHPFLLTGILLLIGLAPIVIIVYFQTIPDERHLFKIKQKFNLDKVYAMGRIHYVHAVAGTVDTKLYRGMTREGRVRYIVDITKEMRVVGQYRHLYQEINEQDALKVLKTKPKAGHDVN